ncbi:MAG: OB-fold domain-containing protein [Bryobacteraceae bacterium]|nr:OB-fold domain-containing protein [Bryobacteraceae bacterium]
MSTVEREPLGNGTVYTETVVWSPPEAFLNEVPYQIAIVSLEGGRRVTARIAGERVAIDDAVEFVEFRDCVPCFRKR